ncbi:hypothetical protein R5R35_005393 [Gryllus longicercus]|uniref:Uncharacterized protein n=1 Tax=Gryllus longicercus TaxID=2509291 RepID=A0AAN9V7H0_9ORTH
MGVGAACVALAALAALAALGRAGRADAGALGDLAVFVPEVLPALPGAALDVSFGDLAVDFGTDVSPTDAQRAPALAWDAQDAALYTVAITNPDIPTIEQHIYGELVHWLVGNVAGNDVSAGDPVWEYLSPGPPKETGTHRYVVLVLKQPGRLTFDGEPRNNATTLDDRFHFSLQKFAEKHGLELPPVAGNFFQSTWDPTVDKLAQVRTFKGQVVATLKP